jgi:phosphoglucosamine mutase
MKTLFGTDGMRGVAGEFPMDFPTIRTVGASLANHLKSKNARSPLILIGRDTRESGSWLESALVQGAVSSGAECQSAGVITTPGVAFLTRSLKADAGVVISASHNPYHDNGIKIFSPSGRKLDDATERLIEKDIFAHQQKRGDQNSIEPITTNVELRERYLEFLITEIGKGLSLTGSTIVADCANGAASSLAPILFERLGARVIAINNQPDGKNINKDSGSLHLDNLRHAVIDEKADLGVAFDGDADRALFVDEAGNSTDGDATLWILANYLQARGELNRQIVVATVMSNIGLELALRSRGMSLVRADVGDKFVLDELLRLDASLGGEQSGHIILPRLSLAGDGMITALCLLRSLREAGKSLNELAFGFERYPQILVNVKVREKRPFVELNQVQAIVEDVETELTNRGRLLLRYSGTEPLARIMIEGQNQAEIENYAQKLADAIRLELGN